MFDSVDSVHDCIRIATGVLSTIRTRPERMLKGLSADMLATDLAEYLVRKGACFGISIFKLLSIKSIRHDALPRAPAVAIQCQRRAKKQIFV